MPKRAVLHIPYEHTLLTQPVEYWIQRFRNVTLREPTEVVLPAISYLGPTFDSSVSGVPRILEAGNRLPDWLRQVRDILGAETPVWGSVTPSMAFMQLQTLMIRDQYGTRFHDQACLTNRVAQGVLGRLTGEMAQIGVSGAVLDCVDITPNSGTNILEGQLQNACFCNDCLTELKISGWRHGERDFIGPGNISRLVLHLTEDGADFIDAPHAWLRDSDATALLQMSEARGFVTDKDTTRREEADRLLQYLRARGKVTATSIRRIGIPIREQGMRYAVILGVDRFDVSQGTDLDFLLDVEAADEYWLPGIDQAEARENSPQILAYLYRRGSYVINNLFEHIAKADETIAEVGIEAYLQRLVKLVAKAARANRLSASTVFAVEASEEYSGFVGVPLGQEDMVRQVEQLTSGTLGQVVPPAVIEQLITSVNIAVPSS